MIKRLKYDQIDFEKYSSCLSSSVQKNFFAQKEVLDFFCNSWDLIVYGDYEHVMPVPLQKKLASTYVAMPLFIQQLGVFSRKDDVAVNDDMASYLTANYSILSYSFNYRNKLNQSYSDRKNYIIQPQDYEQLRKNFSKGRKSVLKPNNEIEFKSTDLTPAVKTFVLQHFRGLPKRSDVEKFISFLNVFGDKMRMTGVYYKGQLVSLGVFTETEVDFGLIALINDKIFKKLNAPSLLINEFLKAEIADKTLDFMGGNVESIGLFFRSFGAEMVQYPVIEYSKKQLIRKIFGF